MSQYDALDIGGAAEGTSEPILNEVPYPRYSETTPTSFQGNKFYINRNYGGWSNAITGSDLRYGYYKQPGCVLANCVGYVRGRFNEIAGSWKYTWTGNANKTIDACRALGLNSGMYPKPGAIIVWDSSEVGHVEIVEKVVSPTEIITSASGYGFKSGPFRVYHRKLGSDGNWRDGCSWMGKDYKLLGFVYHPNIAYNFPTNFGGPLTEAQADIYAQSYSQSAGSSASYDLVVDYKDVTGTVTRETLRTAEYSGQLNTHSTGLLSIPTYVEAPYISVRFGDYVLGTYSRNTSRYHDRISEVVQYPNYINSLTVKKINGSVNQYTINIIYQVQPGQDPNFIDKILSSVQYGNIYISYGDCNAPNFYYKEEEALIINVSSNVDFSSSRITYVISATSSSFQLYGGNRYFAPRTNTKPSDVIYEIFKNNNNGLKTIFKGMNEDNFNNFVARNDKKVNIEEKRNTDPLSYINYLVSCMINEKDTDPTDPLKSSNYYMTIEDDQLSDYGGSYFTVREVQSTTKTLYSPDTYEVDIGFPTPNMVENFSINDNNSWALLYKYSSKIDPVNYTYSIDNQGNIRTEFSPTIMTSALKNKMTPVQKTWWTQMTQFPISATLTIKGLVRPAMLMTYVRINSYFYGQRHISSGLYIITGQEDKVDGGGYRTTLSLQRIGSDEDYIVRTQETVTAKVPIIKTVLTNNGGTNKQTQTSGLTLSEVQKKKQEAKDRYDDPSRSKEEHLDDMMEYARMDYEEKNMLYGPVSQRVEESIGKEKAKSIEAGKYDAAMIK